MAKSKEFISSNQRIFIPEIEISPERFHVLHLNQMPAFFMQREKIAPEELVHIVNELREHGIYCNPVEGNKIVGLLPSEDCFNYLLEYYAIFRNSYQQKGIRLTMGVPSENTPTTVIFDTKKQELDIGSPAVVAANRAWQSVAKTKKKHEQWYHRKPSGNILNEIIAWQPNTAGFYGKMDTSQEETVLVETEENRFSDISLTKIRNLFRRGLVDLTEILPYQKVVLQPISEIIQKIDLPQATLLQLDIINSTKFFNSGVWEVFHKSFVLLFAQLEEELPKKIHQAIFIGYSRMTESISICLPTDMQEGLLSNMNILIQEFLNRLCYSLSQLYDMKHENALIDARKYRELLQEERDAQMTQEEQKFSPLPVENIIVHELHPEIQTMKQLISNNLGLHFSYDTYKDLHFSIVGGTSDMVTLPDGTKQHSFTKDVLRLVS